MNTKALSLTSLVAAVAVAITPVSGAVAATSTPGITPVAAAANSVVTPAAVIKNIAAAPAGSVGSLVVVTDDAAKGAPSASSAVPAAFASAAAPSAAVAADAATPAIPASVTDALNLIGLPVQAVFGVVQRANGVYTVWYKLLTTVPQAIWQGKFGSVPGIFSQAVADSITWITTGAGPKAPEKPVAAAADKDVPAAAVPNPFSAALDVAGIPVATAFAAGQAGLSIYQNFYGLLTSVPQAIWQGKFGDVPTLVINAVTKSITTIVDFPGAQIKAATTKIEALIASLNPVATVAPSTTSSDTLSLASEQLPLGGTDKSTGGSVVKAADSAKPEKKPEVELAVKPEVKAEVKPEAKPEVAPETKSEVKPEVKAEVKPEAKTDVKSESAPEAKPEVAPETKPAVEEPKTVATESKPVADSGKQTDEAKVVSTDTKSADSSAVEKNTDEKSTTETGSSEK